MTYIHRTKFVGYFRGKNRIAVKGNLIKAVKADHPFESLIVSDFEEISAEEYENTVWDCRFEDGIWQQ